MLTISTSKTLPQDVFSFPNHLFKHVRLINEQIALPAWPYNGWKSCKVTACRIVVQSSVVVMNNKGLVWLLEASECECLFSMNFLSTHSDELECDIVDRYFNSERKVFRLNFPKEFDKKKFIHLTKCEQTSSNKFLMCHVDVWQKTRFAATFAWAFQALKLKRLSFWYFLLLKLFIMRCKHVAVQTWMFKIY